LQFILGQRSCGSSVASLIFLTMRASGVEPVPGNPAGIAPLNDQDDSVGGKQMPVLHGAEVEK
jgi:hypothetical protein